MKKLILMLTALLFTSQTGAVKSRKYPDFKIGIGKFIEEETGVEIGTTTHSLKHQKLTYLNGRNQKETITIKKSRRGSVHISTKKETKLSFLGLRMVFDRKTRTSNQMVEAIEKFYKNDGRKKRKGTLRNNRV